MKKITAYDVVIIGGGPAGSAAAIRLQQLSNMSVLLIERHESSTHRVGESIPPETSDLLKILGLWDQFQNQHHDPCLGSCSAWGSETLGYNDFLYNPMGHGWHLNREKFNQMLLESVKNSMVSLRVNTQFIHSKKTASGHLLTLKSSQQSVQVHANWVIDATGIKSSFAHKAGHQAIHQDYQVCLTGFFDQADGPELNQLTLLEATAYGWWYAAKLPNKQTVVALACDRDFMHQFKLRKEANWLKLLLAHSEYIAPQIIQQQWRNESLTINRTPSCIQSQIVGDQWLATGDAACSYDPISAQGVYKALSQGIKAAESINQFQLGQSDALHRYSQNIKQQYAIYLEQRNHLYQQEMRWADRPFWRHRQQPLWVKSA